MVVWMVSAMEDIDRLRTMWEESHSTLEETCLRGADTDIGGNILIEVAMMAPRCWMLDTGRPVFTDFAVCHQESSIEYRVP